MQLNRDVDITAVGRNYAQQIPGGLSFLITWKKTNARTKGQVSTGQLANRLRCCLGLGRVLSEAKREREREREH